MAEELVRLVVEVDASKVAPAMQRAGTDFAKSVGQMDAQSKRAEGSLVAVGAASVNAGKVAASAMRAMSAGIGAATAAAAAQQRSWLALGATILSTFAAGGPVAGSVALLGAGIGLLTSKADEFGDRMKANAEKARAAVKDLYDEAVQAGVEAERASRSDLENAQADAARLRERADAVGGIAGMPLGSLGEIMAAREVLNARAAQLATRGDAEAKAEAAALDQLNEKLKALEPLAIAAAVALERLQDAQRARAKGQLSATSDGTLEAQAREAQVALQAARAGAAGALGDLSEAARRAAANAEGRAALAIAREDLRLRDLSAGSIRQAEAMQRVFNGERADEVRLDQEIAELAEKIATLAEVPSEEARKEARELGIVLEAKKGLLDATRAINRASADRDLDWELRMLRAVTDEERARVAIEREIDQRRRSGASEGLLAELSAARAMQPTIEFARQLSDTVRGGLTDAIVDGLTNGFRNGTDIARSLFDQLLRQTVGSLVGSLTSALPNLLVGLLGGGGGGGLGGIFGAVAGAFGGGGSAGGGLGGIIGGGLGGGAAPLPDT